MGYFVRLLENQWGLQLNISHKIPRQEQDMYAVSSQKKALEAINNGSFSQQVVPVPVTQGKTTSLFSVDEQPRKDTNMHILAQLKPGFLPNGTITAANACTLNDGAAAVILSSGSYIKKNHIKPMAKILQYSYVGLDPKFMGIGGYYAAQQCLKKAHMTTKDINLWEINEAFACSSIAVQRLLDIDEQKINVNGGAIALGHPIGASGARILTTLLYELKKQSKQYGIVSLCIGGGQGIAMAIENI
jgi:acetyl-CoA C-acetyltransferase